MRRAGLAGLLAALLYAVLSTAPAWAGTYEVLSCAASGGVNRAWQSFNEDPASLSVGDSCSSVAGGPEDGLFTVDRIPGPPNTPKDRAAGWRLTAVDGTRITRITAQYYLGQNSAGEWFPYIRTGEGVVLDTCQPPGGDPECKRGTEVYDPFGPVSTYELDAQSLEAGVRCAASTGACGNGATLHHAWVALYSTRVEVTDPTAPSLSAPSGPLWVDSYLRGSQSVTLAATDTTGIRQTRLLVDGVPRSTRERACDFTYVVPCSNESGSLHSLNTAALVDGSHELKAVVEDAAGNQATAARSVVVDNTAPSPPLDLVVGPSPAAAPTAFTVAWRNPPGQVAPIAAANWSLCRPGGASCVTGSRREAGVDRSGAAEAPATGVWELRVWLEDAAGNVDPAHAAGPERLSLTAPAGQRKPRLKVTRVRRRGNQLSVSGSSASSRGKVTVRVERRLGQRTLRASGRAEIRRGRWTRRLRLRGRLAAARRTRLVVRFPAQNGFQAQTLRRTLRR